MMGRIGLDAAELVESSSSDRIQVDGGTRRDSESEHIHLSLPVICECISRTADRASANVSGTVLGPVHAPA